MLAQAIRKISEQQNLSQQEAYESISEIFSGQASDAQIAAFLTGLRVKGETVDEITGGVRSLMAAAIRISPRVDGCVDIVGTGGDGAGTFNISSAAALVAAGAGACVAKHGNRSVSSRSGAADLFEALGVNIGILPKQAEKCLESVGLAFLFAPIYHPAMRFAAPVRRQLGIRSLFNLLGPLANPASPASLLLGVCAPGLLDFMAEVLREMGVSRALVVHGRGHEDEISLSGPTDCRLLDKGCITREVISPDEFGLQLVSLSELQCGTPAENARLVEDILNGKPGAPRDIVLLNAAAALFVAGLAGPQNSGFADSILEGLALARRSIDSGDAKSKLQALRLFTNPDQGGAAP